MGDIRCRMDISMAQDPQMININCFQYDLSIKIQNTFFDEKKNPNFDVINNMSSNLYFTKGMRYKVEAPIHISDPYPHPTRTPILAIMVT
jgi:hypothetical protein